MIQIIEAIKTKDWRSVQTAINGLIDCPSISADALIEILETFSSIVSAFPNQFIGENKGDQIIWHRYETLIWETGEVFRQVLKRHKTLRMDLLLLSKLERVTLDYRFGKGRQSFVMLLGQYGNRNVVATLQQLLEDPEVQGHAVYALRLLGAYEVQESLRPFLQFPKKWVRNEAKKYFKKLEKQNFRS
jgi:hypothetical protein